VSRSIDSVVFVYFSWRGGSAVDRGRDDHAESSSRQGQDLFRGSMLAVEASGFERRSGNRGGPARGRLEVCIL